MCATRSTLICQSLRYSNMIPASADLLVRQAALVIGIEVLVRREQSVVPCPAADRDSVAETTISRLLALRRHGLPGRPKIALTCDSSSSGGGAPIQCGVYPFQLIWMTIIPGERIGHPAAMHLTIGLFVPPSRRRSSPSQLFMGSITLSTRGCMNFRDAQVEQHTGVELENTLQRLQAN